MRIAFAIVLGLLAGAAIPPAKADPYQWCAVYGPEDTGTNCYFLTLPQCQATVSGIGGFCTRNNFYNGRPVAEDDSGSRRIKKREPH